MPICLQNMAIVQLFWNVDMTWKREQKAVEEYWQNGILQPESNVQFGEGGAGTFSDGKLNTLVKDKYGRSKEVMKIFVQAGAPTRRDFV